jgi:hypothetical protein
VHWAVEHYIVIGGQLMAGVVNYYGDLDWRWQPANQYALYTGVRLSRLGDWPAASPMAGACERVSLRTALTYYF